VLVRVAKVKKLVFWGYPPEMKVPPEERRFSEALVSLRGVRRGGEKFFRGVRKRMSKKEKLGKFVVMCCCCCCLR
jgi:hypothetical protein